MQKELENGAAERWLVDGKCSGGLPRSGDKNWRWGRKIRPRGPFIGDRGGVVGSRTHKSATTTSDLSVA
jgi:hypothetical protein